MIFLRHVAHCAYRDRRTVPSPVRSRRSLQPAPGDRVAVSFDDMVVADPELPLEHVHPPDGSCRIGIEPRRVVKDEEVERAAGAEDQ